MDNAQGAGRHFQPLALFNRKKDHVQWKDELLPVWYTDDWKNRTENKS